MLPLAPKKLEHEHGICYNFVSQGEVAEWLKAAASKAVVRFYRTVGSNPTLSAIILFLRSTRINNRRQSRWYEEASYTEPHENNYRFRLKALLSFLSRPSLRHSVFFAHEDAFQRKYRIGAKKPA